MMTIRDEDRERRIQDEAIVDAYGPDEQAIGWHYYLEEHVIFFQGALRLISHNLAPKVDE